MKLISKMIAWNNFTFLAGHSDRYSVIEFDNMGGPLFKVDHDVSDPESTIVPREKLTITFDSMSQRKSLIRGLRFMADVLEDKYDGIATEERAIEDDRT
jgi:hypothetical protein